MSKLREDLMQCWLAEALVHVLERASKENYVLVSIGDGAIAEQGAVLSRLMQGFLRRDAATITAKTSSSPFRAGSYTHVNNVNELQQWTCLPRIIRAGNLNGVLFVVYAPCENEGAAKKQVRDIIDATVPLEKSWRDSVLLVLHNSTVLMGLGATKRALKSSSMYHVGHFGATETPAQTMRAWPQSFQFIAQPLDGLREQCGWPFVMEIVQWGPEAAGSATNDDDTFGPAARASMFSSINQWPFQLLLLVLRWSHFHPQLVQACARKLQRQTQLIPQARVRRELAEMQKREVQVWSGLYPLATAVDEMDETMHRKDELSLSLQVLLETSSRSQVMSPNLARLSKCCLWDTQKQFYKDQGIRAWASGAIPFGVSSSSFLAAAYARIATDFLLSNAESVRPPMAAHRFPNCFVWEAASGSCKFLHSFMLHFTELVRANNEFNSRGLVPLVVATDLSDHVLNSRRQMPCFRPFIDCGLLDFARFDTREFVHGNDTVSGTQKTLELLHSRRQWHVGSDGPVILMGNYFLDSLRADIFTVALRQHHLPATNANQVHGHDDESNERIVVQVALLDETTSKIADMDIRLRPIADSNCQAIYGDDRLNATLVQILDQFRSRRDAPVSAAVSSTGLIIFPVEAFEFFLTLLDRDRAREAFPIAILTGDARFSFRDAISSAFITTESVSKTRTGEEFTGKVSLELPQLSPHPDCFCLPVDFEIFEMFFEQLNRSTTGSSASTMRISPPASDTFDVFFAAVEPRMQEPAVARGKASLTPTKAQHTSFKHQFANFTPGDCDLLWGMMSFDDGARYFSADTLLAILAQTGWDFDLFEVLRWELLGRWRRQEIYTTSKHYRNALVEAGVKSWRTFYHMEQQTEIDITTQRTGLQLARWFYVLEANDSVLKILMPWREKAHKDITSDDVAIFYLLGRTSLRMNEYWDALSFFRLCARLVPTKVRFQRQVTRTLLALQTSRSASNSSNASDGK